MSPNKQKILLLLLSGIALGYTYLPNRQWRILKGVAREWKRINEKKLRDEIRQLYQSKLVDKKQNSDGSISLFLTEKGKSKALTYHFENMQINKSNWDGKWRIVAFDIPEKLKKGRDALRRKLKELGFREFQKSVFVFPHECQKEIEFIIEFFNLRRYVRVAIAQSIDNELHLKRIFKLI
jgi:DNA-binding transcriptional regulator PaaX